jgi:hypothetical protein
MAPPESTSSPAAAKDATSVNATKGAAASVAAVATKDKAPFPVGPAGKRELRNELKATTNPARTIQEFQESHSLHTMMAKAFGTIPSSKYKNTRKTTGAVETMDSDSVLKFLSHLGVRQYEVHKRVSDSLLQQLCEDIRNTDQEEPLLDLLQACWVYSTTISELRPVLWALLKQLGPRTPLPVLTALTERTTTTANDDKEAKTTTSTTETTTSSLRYAEIFKPLPLSFKRWCWEADWDNRIVVPLEQGQSFVPDPAHFLHQAQTTVLYETLSPHLDSYLNDPLLSEAASRIFGLTIAERRILTTQRRALTKRSAAPSTAAGAPSVLTTGKAVSQLRNLLCDASYRPKLLYAVLSILMAPRCHREGVFGRRATFALYLGGRYSPVGRWPFAQGVHGSSLPH